MRNPKWPQSRPVKPSDDLNKYKDNFYITPKESYFNNTSTSVFIKIPVPNNNYKIKGVYDLAKFMSIGGTVNNFRGINLILLHVTDGTADTGFGINTKFFLEGEIKYNEILDHTCQPSGFSMERHEGLIVIIYNDNGNLLPCQRITEEMTEEEKAHIFKTFTAFYDDGALPKESGGGVIIEGP